MIVLVKHARKDTWANTESYKDCKVYLCANLTRSGSLNTGLTPEDESRLEEVLGYEKGHLNKNSEFWHTYAVAIPSKGLTLDTSIPQHEMQYLLLKSHKLVAQGYERIAPNKDFVMINQEMEAISKNKANKYKRDAIMEFGKMSPDQMRKCLRILGYNADNSSPEVVESKLFEFIENDPQAFFDRWVNNKTKDIEFIISQAVAKNVLRKNRTTYYYGTDIIGSSLDDAIEYLRNKNNADIKAAIVNAIDSKEMIIE